MRDLPRPMSELSQAPFDEFQTHPPKAISAATVSRRSSQTSPRRNGRLKRDRQLVSSGLLVAQKPRKDAAVHVSLSSDEIVKQRSRATTLRSRQPQRTPCAPQTRQNPIPDLSPLLSAEAESKNGRHLPAPSSQKGRTRHRNRSYPTDPLTSGVAVSGADIGEASPPCQTLFRNNSPIRHKRAAQTARGSMQNRAARAISAGGASDHIPFVICPRISPGLCAAVWMLKYIIPSSSALAWSAVSVAEPLIGLASEPDRGTIMGAGLPTGAGP